MPTTLSPPQSAWFRGPIQRSAPGRVDREASVIHGVSVATAGVISDRNLEFDETTLQQLAKLGNQAPKGVKARFTHPNMSNDGLGSFLGRFRNFSIDGNQVRADLHLSQMAFKSPRGDLGSYVLDLADDDPDSFGASVVVRLKREKRLNADGTAQKDSAGNELPELARMERLHATDVVDTPAANAGLFDDSFPDAGVRQASAFLDSLLDAGHSAVEIRDRVFAFLRRYFESHGLTTPVVVTPVVCTPDSRHGSEEEGSAMPDTAIPVLTSAGTDGAAAAGSDQLNLAAFQRQLEQVGSQVVERMAGELDKKLKERAARDAEIGSDCAKFGIEQAQVDAFVASGKSPDQVRKEILERLASNQLPVPNLPRETGLSVTAGEAERDKFAGGMTDALTLHMLRAGKLSEEQIERHLPTAQRRPGCHDFQYASLYDLACDCLEQFGVPVRQPGRRLSRSDVARLALWGDRASVPGVRFSGVYGWHTTGSLPKITQDAMNKTLLAAYVERPTTWRSVFRQAPSAVDFKKLHRIRMSEVPNLGIWPAQGPKKEVGLTDEEETYAVEAYGEEISFSWKLIVNDDMNTLTRVPALMGAAAARTVNAVVWGVVTANPTMQDAVALFSTATGNRKKANLGTAGAISKTTLGEARKLMRLQVGVNTKGGNASEAFLNLEARFLVIPAEAELTALEQVMSQFDPTIAAANTTNPSNVVNQFRNLQVVVEPLLDANSTTAWYMFASPQDIDTIECTFLQGQEQPVTQMEEDFHNWAITYQIVQSFAAAAIDFRGCFKNAGA